MKRIHIFALLAAILLGCIGCGKADTPAQTAPVLPKECPGPQLRDDQWIFDISLDCGDTGKKVLGLTLWQYGPEEPWAAEYTQTQLEDLRIDSVPPGETLPLTARFPVTEGVEGFVFRFRMEGETVQSFAFRTANAVPEAEELPSEETEPPTEAAPPQLAPEGWDQRVLSDERLEELLYQYQYDPFAGVTLETLRQEICTVPDAIRFLDLRFPTLCHDSWGQTIGTNKYAYSEPENKLMLYTDAGRQDIPNLLMYLLEDDHIPIGMLWGICVPNAMMHENASLAAAYVLTDDGYVVFDPVQQMQADLTSRDFSLLPEGTFASLEEYALFAKDYEPTLWVLYHWDKPGEIQQIREPAKFRLSFVNPEPTLLLRDDKLGRLTLAATPYDIQRFHLSTMLGGVTMTAQEAMELVEADPEEVKDRVKTAADVLLYMIAAQITDSQGDMVLTALGQNWHYNRSALEVMESGLGNCGSCTSLANYLLEGDYEDVGHFTFVYYPYPRGNGSHTVTSILYEGKYYLVDFSMYVFNWYDPSLETPVLELDSLDTSVEPGSDLLQSLTETYGEICAVYVFDSNSRGIPCVFDDTLNCLYLPEDAQYQILYQDPSPDAFRLTPAFLPDTVPR